MTDTWIPELAVVIGERYCCKAYRSHVKGAKKVTMGFVGLFDELARLEQELGTQMGNSPTQTVGWPAKDWLAKASHPIPLLSLDKTKQVDELCNFIGDQPVMLMLKLDGLTIKATYEYGMIVEAATRGNGDEGENVTHNVRGISGIPSQIPYKGRLVVTGEAFIRPSDFEALQDTLVDSSGQPYKNGRNLAAGSVRLLKSEDCRERRVTFMPFNVLEGFDWLPTKSERLWESFLENGKPEWLTMEQIISFEKQMQSRQPGTDGIFGGTCRPDPQ